MSKLNPATPSQIISALLPSDGYFPNNPSYPLLIYKKALPQKNNAPKELQHHLQKNSWGNSWVNGIYDYHHYHSNTHEVLVVYDGNCKVQFGGPQGQIYEIDEGDVVILPAGTSHKRLSCSINFKCVGAYPDAIDYDMKYGKKEEHPEVEHNIKLTELPEADPIFGKEGLLFEYWFPKNL